LVEAQLWGLDGVAVGVFDGGVQQDSAHRELRRVLSPGGRAVLTCWERLDLNDERVLDRLRRVDLGA